ncbi:NAD(P)H-dependent glycerol-3-phosphate dehydrogenase [Saccharibacillus kuerlensis]|uniref:Glycerol-3-phosphate dehydrogenase [NAD(P)+] n=1 Tax=Saccharibacillus kuerlensis TaxID=459527 RepID=A0ABQ2L5V4_9BACL|nr:NAD(P)H-dependent glycerol-3-phosphate dehydrogenase [Saccharibacillus kuerlensis]GGO04435.1 glycerol-3-phosphate dehydrogenase [NAD(P)+] [Saccharibacillus kuerlensis]
MAKKVCVLVGGSWGTALAMVLADNGHDVRLWARSEEQVNEINKTRENSRFLPGVKLPDGIRATTSMEEAVKDAEAVIIVAPSKVMREVARMLKPFWREDMLCIHATKGLEIDTLKRMSTIIAEELECDESKIGVICGPSHAEEVARRRPTTIVVASSKEKEAELAQNLLMNAYFRVYTNRDVLGAELAGAFKNIIALGAGMSDGLEYGDNAKAALLTRGLAEITRVGTVMGANPLTFSGLAGVGDLVVTATSRHSRNWRAGYLLGQGKPLQEVLDSMGMVVEGIRTIEAAHMILQKYKVQMPIAEQLYHVLFEGLDPRTAVEALMGRGPKTEMEMISQETWEQWHT